MFKEEVQAAELTRGITLHNNKGKLEQIILHSERRKGVESPYKSDHFATMIL